jgi:hypothetical protein
MPTLSTYGDDGVAPLFFRVADRMRMEGYVSALIQDNMSLSIVSSHDAILDHYGKLLVARLREAAPHMGLEATEGVALLGEGELAPRRRFWQKSRLARQPLFCCALAVLAEQAVLRASMASRSAALPFRRCTICVSVSLGAGPISMKGPRTMRRTISPNFSGNPARCWL